MLPINHFQQCKDAKTFSSFVNELQTKLTWQGQTKFSLSHQPSIDFSLKDLLERLDEIYLTSPMNATSLTTTLNTLQRIKVLDQEARNRLGKWTFLIDWLPAAKQDKQERCTLSAFEHYIGALV